MDPIVVVIVVVVGTPLAVIWALAKSAQLRGPARHGEPRRPVGSLVTEAIPEEHPDQDEPTGSEPHYRVDSPPPESDP